MSQQGKANIAALEAANYGYDFSKAGNGTVTVTKATPKATMSGNGEKTYDGTPIANYVPTITITAPSENSVTLTTGDFEWVKDGQTYTTAPSAAGTYTAELTEQGLNKLKAVNATNLDWSKITSVMGGTYKIDKATPTAKMSGNGEKTYDGTPIANYAPTITIKAPGENSVTLTTGDFEWVKDGQTSTTAPSDAGTYTVQLTQQGLNKVKAVNADNLDWSNVSVTGNGSYTIDKAQATVTISNTQTPYDVTYNGQTPAIDLGKIKTSISTNNKVDLTAPDTLTANDFEWVDEDGNPIPAPVNAGTYYLKLKDSSQSKIATNSNYNWTFGGLVKVTIKKAMVNATLSDNFETKTPSLNAGGYKFELTVDDKQQTIQLTNDDLVLSQNGQAVGQLTKAGTYDVNFSQKFIDYLNRTYPSGNYAITTSSTAKFILDNSSQTINYIDANGKVIGSTTVGGDDLEGTTVKFDSQDHVPAGWVMTNPSAAPTEVTLENGTTTIAIQHGKITVRPGETAPTGKVPGAPDASYEKMEALTKTPTRTILVTNPDQSKRTITQSVTFERIATFDTVTGKATYSDWTQTGDPKSWAAYDRTLPGYTTLINGKAGTTIPAVTDITEKTKNVTVDVTYVKNAATITISGPAQSKIYDGQAAEITDEIANKINHQINGDS